MKHRIHYINLVLFVGGSCLILSGCLKGLDKKAVNIGVGTSGAMISATPSPQNGGNAFSVFAGSTFGIWQTVPNLEEGQPHNTCLVQRTEETAWYCASIKKTTVAVTITSDTPIVMDWAAMMNAVAPQAGTK